MKRHLIIILLLPFNLWAESATWTAPAADTWLQSDNASASNYSSTKLDIYSSASTDYTRALVFFEGIPDSLLGAVSIDSALFEANYNGGASGGYSIRVCRMVSDGSWKEGDSLKATWNSRYDNDAADSIAWSAGWGNHEWSYTASNSVIALIADTTESGWLQWVITNIIADIVQAGSDYGLIIMSDSAVNNGFNGVNLESNEHTDDNPPRLYIEYSMSGISTPIRRRHLIEQVSGG